MAGFEFSFLVDIAPWEAAHKEMKDKHPKAIMWSMREAGRAIKAKGQSRAPVFTGALKASITSSRNIVQAGDGFRMSVGPHGPIVSQYSGVQQGRFAYMDPNPGQTVIAPRLESALMKAFGRFL